MNLLLFILIILILGSQFKDGGSQTWNGADLPQRDIKHHASIFKDNSYICAGGIVDEKHVITAFHCVNDFEEKRLKVIAGVKDWSTELAKMALVENIIPATGEYSKGKRYDIALLVLETPFVLGDNIGVIKLPTAPVSIFDVNKCSVTGLERNNTAGLRPSKMSSINMVLISVDVIECITQRIAEYPSLLYAVADEGTDLTTGDSGSVLVCDEVAVGMVAEALNHNNESQNQVYRLMPIFDSIEFIRRRGSIFNPWHD